MLRADLDGFSARVRRAFSDGDYGLQKLVEEFCTLIDYPKHFADKLPAGVQTVVFPWAGDCANLFLTCDDYDSERGYLPNRLGLEWHTLADQVREGIAWRKLMGQTNWIVAIAGGNPTVEGHGSILTANVAARPIVSRRSGLELASFPRCRAVGRIDARRYGGSS
ncbi:MAG: hypothetical protein WB586_30025 [Chthoniobacterales bacterium]